jgi:prevent-host-death family protein
MRFLVQNLREVKNNLSRVIQGLPRTGPVVITKNGKASAVLLPVEEETDLETLLLSSNRRFWNLFDRAAGSHGGPRSKKLLEPGPPHRHAGPASSGSVRSRGPNSAASCRALPSRFAASRTTDPHRLTRR